MTLILNSTTLKIINASVHWPLSISVSFVCCDPNLVTGFYTLSTPHKI